MGEGFGGGLLGEKPVAEFANGEVGDGGEGLGTVFAEDELGDFVFDQGFGEQGFERQVGEGHLGGYAFLSGGGGESREFVARAFGRGPREQGSEIREAGGCHG